MDAEISTMLAERAEPRKHEGVLKPAPRDLLECMVLTWRLKDTGHERGLSKVEREERILLLAVVVPLKAFILHRLSKQYPDIKKGITCTHVRNDGKIWSRPITLL